MTPRLTPLDPWIAGQIGRPAEPVTRAALEAYQLERLQTTLRLVRGKSRFYRPHLAAAPLEIHQLADLARFPFTTAQDLRRDALAFLCVSQDEIHRVVTLDTSGTTGEPKRLYFTRDDQELTTDFFHIGMSTFTDAGDRVLILLPGERPGSVGDLLATGLQRLGAHPIQHGPIQDLARTRAVLEQEKVTGLVGIPAQVLALARTSPGLKLKSVLLSTDHVPEAIRRAVEQAWGCVVYNHYGMTEMGLGGGVDCEARRGYHLREADLYFEIIDPATGEPAAEGEAGEVVFTTLTRRGLPLIRYRTGDLSRWVPGACPCGTGLKTLEHIRQRADGQVRVGHAVVTMADLDEALFSLGGVLGFSATLTRSGTKDRLNLVVQTLEGKERGLAEACQEVLAAGPWAVAVTVQTGGALQARPVKRTLTDLRGTA